jgi:MFS family permease
MSQTLVETPTSAAATRIRYVVLAWFCTLSMITYIDRVCIKQVQGDMQRDLGLTGSQFSWAFSAFALAYALFEIPTGWLGDRLGPKKVLARIVLCWLFFTALTGLIFGTGLVALVMLLAVRFLFGAGEAGAYPNIARGTRNWFPFAERGRAQGMVWTFGRWGGAIAPLLIVALTVPFDALGWQGWRFGFVLLAILGLAWVWGFVVWFRDHRAITRINEAEIAAHRTRAPAQTRPAELADHAPQPHAVDLECHVFLQQRRLVRLHHLRHQYLEANFSLRLAVERDVGDAALRRNRLHPRRAVDGSAGALLGPRWGGPRRIVAYFLGMAFFILVIRFTGVSLC